MIPASPARTCRTASGSSRTTRLAESASSLAVDLQRPVAGEDDHHLLLLRGGLVVLGAFRAWTELEPVEPERRRADRPTQEAYATVGAGSLDVVDVHDGVALAHARSLRNRDAPT